MIEKFDITKLKSLHNNPRSISKQNFDRLKRDITKDPGFLEKRPLLVNHINGDYIVYAGNMRLKACLDLLQQGNDDFKEIWCDIDEELDILLMRERALRDNVEYGETDYDILANEWEDLVLELDLPELELPTTRTEVKEDDFTQPKEAKYKVELGDIFQLGEHRLMCGDSTKIEDVERLMNGEKADMVFTDPPYGYSYESNHQKKHKMLMNDEEILSFLPLAYLVTEENAPFYICGGWQTIKDWIIQVEDSNLKLKNIIIWKKNNWSMGDLTGAYAGQYEVLFFAHKGRVIIQGKRDRDIWEFDREVPTDHPTKKPVELMAFAINNHNCSKILDLFGGSGSTLIACEQLNRKCYMMELDPYYCSIIIERWEKLTGKKHKKL